MKKTTKIYDSLFADWLYSSETERVEIETTVNTLTRLHYLTQYESARFYSHMNRYKRKRDIESVRHDS